MRPVRALAFCLAIVCPPLAAQSTFKATPTALTFTYQTDQTTLPAAQNLAVSSTSSASALTFSVTLAGGPWLSVSPSIGTTPLAVKVSVNPMTLPVGTYSGTATLTTTESTPQTVVVPVTLTVKAPPATLTASPNPVSVNYVKGAAAPADVPIALSTSGGVLSWSASVSGATWLTVSPKSGVSWAGFPATLNATVNPANLAPGTYKATITITSPTAANKSQTVILNLTVNAGLPVLTSIWPTQVVEGSPATIITLTGANFFSGTVIKAGTTALSSTLVGANVMTATIPASLIATPGALSILANNAGPGGGDSATQTFTVLSSAPTVVAVVNAASFLGGTVTPGEMVTVFGSLLGPDTLTTFAPVVPGNAIATTLAGTRVLFDTTAAPVVYTSSGQVTAMVPYDVASKSTVQVAVEYNSVQSTAVTANVAAAAPGIFTSAGTGAGQAAAFNFDENTLAYTLNGDSAAAPKGSIIVFYATGEGVPLQSATDGLILSSVATTPNPAISVQVGGQDATILYTGGVVGLISGLIQINARLPNAVAGGKLVPLQVTINGIQSPPGVTINVK